MKILWLDPFSGASGDMFLGLLVDLGVDPAWLESALRTLPYSDWSIDWQPETRGGIAGTRAIVTVPHEHSHRTWREIDQTLAASRLEPAVAALAQRIFARLARAEAKVHGVAPEAVHFHEVGALDSILDIVGAAAGLVALQIEEFVCGPLPLNTGSVESAHGTLPLPAPATLELLRGWPVFTDPLPFELLTPTGAAIIAEIACPGLCPKLAIETIGYGAGSRELSGRPNLLRGVLGHRLDAAAAETVTVIESHIDDSTPEILGYLLERLLAAGALDAGYTPLQMQKNRPGVRLTVVAAESDCDALCRLILHESSAIGVRFYRTGRMILDREAGAVTTPLGLVAVKKISEGGRLLRVTPEYDSCAALAQQSGQPLAEIYRMVEAAGAELIKRGGE